MQEPVRFQSDGLTLAGIAHVPDDLKPGERRPAFLVLHGFGGNKDGEGSITIANLLCDKGYVAVRFDHRGCGESEGERAFILCLDQVEDTKNAVTYMQGREDVDPDRIAVVGSSFGAAVAVYTAGVDERVATAISSGGWGDGERKFRGQHPTPEAWKKFTDMLAKGKEMHDRGERLMVPRFDIVPIPQHLRGNLGPGSIMEFPWDTAQSMFDFRADDVVGNIAPRPLLLLHASNDSVTPTEQSLEMFKRAGQPTDLHLFAAVDHFMFAQQNVQVHSVLEDWLQRYFPVK